MTKTALITGATAGFGRAAARLFVAGRLAGDRHRPAHRPARRARGGARRGLPPGDPGHARPGGGRGLRAGDGAVDLLVNNAGLASPLSPLQDAEWGPLEQVIETNISGLVALTRATLPGLIARKGAVINISSVAANYPYRGGAVYGGSKAFVREFSLCLRARPARQRRARDLDRAGHGAKPNSPWSATAGTRPRPTSSMEASSR